MNDINITITLADLNELADTIADIDGAHLSPIPHTRIAYINHAYEIIKRLAGNNAEVIFPPEDEAA